ncbi:hypothetical protein Tco_1050961, partial [Tanacetum coccineum]
MDRTPSHPLPPTPMVSEMHKEAQQAAGGPTSLGVPVKMEPTLSLVVDMMLQQISQLKLILEYLLLKIPYLNNREDLSDILKDTRFAFFTPDSPTDEPIIVLDESPLTSISEGLLEQAKVKSEAEVASMKAKPSYPDTNQLTELLVAKLKNIQWELPVTFLDLPHLVSLFQEKLKTLDSLPGLLNKVTNTLNRFATLVGNASGATAMDVPSADKATASPAEGEKDADTNLKNELVDLLGIDIVTQYYNKKLLYGKYCEKMKKRKKISKIISCDVLTKKGPISLKVYRKDGTTKVIEKFKT